MGKYFKVRQSEWTQDFRLINYQDASEFGVCYSGTKQVWITLHRHESFEQVIDTIIHESLHQAICSKTVIDEDENHDVEQEHEIIKRMFWYLNDWV